MKSLCVFLIVLVLAPFLVPPFYVNLLNYIGLYSLVTMGLLLLTGVGGLTSFGQAAFVGVGAYTTAALSTGVLALPGLFAWMQYSAWLALLAGLALTFCIALALGSITLRLSGHFLPLGTIAWGMSLYYLFGTFDSMGGQTGLSGIPAIQILNHKLSHAPDIYFLIWFFFLMAAWTTKNLLDSREGRAIRTLKGGMVMAEAMGIDTSRTRMVIFVIASLQASAAGWLYAHMLRFVNPTPFSLQYGIDYLFMAVVGGAGQVWGALMGASVITIAKQWLQDLLPQLLGRTGNFETIVFGCILIVLLQRSNNGLWGLVARLRARYLPAKSAPIGSPLQAPPKTLLAQRTMPPKGSLVLQAANITRRFGGLIANQDISLSVHAGEILALIGPNGAGKSTLFNQLSGVDTPSAGRIFLQGKPVHGLGARAIARLGLSRSFQHVRILPQMSALENVAIGCHQRGRKGVLACAWRLDRSEELRLLHVAAQQLERVGLKDFIHTEAGALALGQQRILEIARALASDPMVLLLDEPAAGLRHMEKQALADLLNKLRSQGMAILLVEHDMDFVMNLVDRVVVMDFGQKIAEGLPHEVQQNPAVQEAYLGGVQA